MALTAKSQGDPAWRLVAFALAAGVPLAAYLATASAHGYWLDAGEFVAASAGLGISHPPGHPLAALVGSAATLIPVGSLELRVAVASALVAAVAAGFLFLAIETTVRSLGVARGRIATPLALGATWLVVGSYGWWFQAVRPEVYALEAALVMVAIERVVALEAAWPTHDVRPIYVASLCLGLALANHHFLAFLVLPAAAPTFARVRRAKGWRPLWLSAGCVTAGLATYLYLPVRAAAGPALNLGEPTSLSRVYWVVSAQAFQKNTGEGVPQPLWERFADVGVQLVDNLHIVPVLLALAGIYALVRTPGARRIGYVWVSVLVVYVAARAWLGFVRSNPDALGYLMPALGAIGALGAAFVGAVLTVLGGANRERPRRTAVLVALVLAALGLTQLHSTVEDASLAQFTATDTFDELRLRELPPHAVVLAHAPQTLFELWGVRASEGARPDVTVVPIPFLPYPGMVNSLVDEHPELTEVLRGYLLEGELRTADLQSLAARRPVLLEMDLRVPRSVYDSTVPQGLFHRVLPDEAYDDDRAEGTEAQLETWRRLDHSLDARALADAETRNQLIWHLYVSALYYAAVGERDSAREATRRGLALNPEARELRTLAEALATDEEGPLDLAPFLPEPE